MRTVLKFCAFYAIICLLSACGESLDKGIGYYKNGDYNRAVEYFSKAADEGNSEAMAYLGMCFFQGTGVEKNKTMYVELIKKSAAAGNKNAKVRLTQIK